MTLVGYDRTSYRTRHGELSSTQEFSIVACLSSHYEQNPSSMLAPRFLALNSAGLPLPLPLPDIPCPQFPITVAIPKHVFPLSKMKA